MRLCVISVLACLLAGASTAQEKVTRGTGAVLRGLDKVDGKVVDMTLSTGQSAELGRLKVDLHDCRYPEGTAATVATDAFAFVTISDRISGEAQFSGWMIASSPALNALEDPRYDVWVMRCSTD